MREPSLGPCFGLKPAACVVVATVRALKMHGGILKADLGGEDPAAVGRGLPNLLRHVENMQGFGLAVVALNHFTTDTEAEIATVRDVLAGRGVEMVVCTHWSAKGPGAEALARGAGPNRRRDRPLLVALPG